MKIGIDIRALMEREYSGVAEYTHNLTKELLRLDKINTYRLFYNSAREMSGIVPEFKQDNVEIIYTRYPNKLFNNILQRLAKWPKIDRLLEVDLFFMPNIGFISLSDSCKKILTVHDLSYLRYREFYSLKRRMWHRLMSAKRMIRSYDKIIAVSENTKRDIVELAAADPDKITVIHSGIDKDFKIVAADNPDLKNVKRKYSLPNRFILFLGAIEPRKNIKGIIRAFEEYRRSREAEPVSLIIAGASGWKNAPIIKAVEKSEYKKFIKIIGYVDKADKVYLYNLAELFIFPSFYEGFGFPPLEAMACGTPVIASNSSSLPEVCGQAALMVNPFDINGLAAGMSALLSDQDLRTDLINKGLAQSRRFSWEDAARKYLEIFRSLIF